MASVTAIMNKVTGDCGEGIKVSKVQRWTERQWTVAKVDKAGFAASKKS